METHYRGSSSVTMETHIIRWSNSVTIMNVNMEYTEDKKAPAW